MTKRSKTTRLGIQAVARRSGLSQHLIRVWERRYGAVKPLRTESNRRLYSESDVLRLALLNRAVHAGHRISDVATIPTPSLEQLVGRATPGRAISKESDTGASGDYVESALGAISQFDSEALGAVLSRADVEIGQTRTLEQVIMPLLEKVGSMWKEGEVRVSQEHLATAVVRNHVGVALASMRYPTNAPAIVVTTPTGQLHDVGALIVAVAAAAEGWHPVYLGSDLPADEIASAALKSDARAVALSVLYPSDDPRLPAELERLRRLLSDEVALVIGGRASAGYISAIDSINAIHLNTIASFRLQLDLLRSGKTERVQSRS